MGIRLARAGARADGRGSRVAVALLALAAVAGLIDGCTSPAPHVTTHVTSASVAPRSSSAEASPRPSPVNVYAHIAPGMMNPKWAGDPYRVYVPNSLSNTVTEINPRTYQVIRTFAIGRQPNHITRRGMARCCGSITPMATA